MMFDISYQFSTRVLVNPQMAYERQEVEHKFWES
jgi:hypothetical protein